MSRWATLERELGCRNQFERSMLADDIMSVVGCEEEKAFELGKTHCNLLSFWAQLFALGWVKMPYADFFKYCLDKKFLGKKDSPPEKAFINVDKKVILRSLDITAGITKYLSAPKNRKVNDIYQISINGNHHFICGIVGDDLNVYIFDTNDRGLGVEIGRAFAKKHDKPDWFKEITLIFNT